jgi:hypothetical protein
VELVGTTSEELLLGLTLISCIVFFVALPASGFAVRLLVELVHEVWLPVRRVPRLDTRAIQFINLVIENEFDICKS